METLTHIGKSVERIDAFSKAAGEVNYGADFRLQGMLYVKVLRSPHPHARLRRVDTSRAARVPGVRLVVTGADFSYTFGSHIKDEPVLARDRVRFAGEGVAAVCAVDEQTAEEAVELIEVEYEPLAAVLNWRDALAEGAPLVHEDAASYQRISWIRPASGTNLAYHFKLRRGDVQRGFADSFRIFEHEFTTDMMQHAPIEPHGAVAQADLRGHVTVWTPTQSPWEIRSTLMEALELPPGKVRVIGLPVGGAFGSKIYTRLEPLLGALALRLPGRSLKFLHTREEEFTSAVVRQPTWSRIRTGVDSEGRILARQIESYWDGGAYSDCTPNVCRNGGYQGSGPYVIPNCHVDAYAVYSNNPVAGALRGYGVPEAAWAYESQMDIIAHEMGIDPLEIRLRNALDVGTATVTGEIITGSIGLKETLRQAAQGIGWDQPKPPPTVPGRLRGRGLACIYKQSRAPSTSQAFVKLHEDGGVEILSSSIEFGQGSQTVFAMIAAEVLGLPVENVTLANPDTDFTPFDRSTSSSRTTFHMGNAIRLAAEDIKSQIVAMASDVFEAPPELIEFRDGQVHVPTRPPMALKQVVTRYFGADASVVGRGTFGIRDAQPTDPETGQSARAAAFWMYATQAVDLEIDPETGQVEILNVCAAHDVGRIINPMNCVQQIEGALAMGIGSALTERMDLRGGKVLNPGFVDYRILTAVDMGAKVDSRLIEAPHPEGPFGAKGIGEPGLAATAAAVGNAILDATGVRMNAIPLVPERIQGDLGSARGN